MSFLKYLGHSSFEMDLEGKRVLFDPWLETRANGIERQLPPAVSAREIKRCDFVLVSHEHVDHCSDASVGEILKTTFAQVIAPEQTLSELPSVPQRHRISAFVGDSFSMQGVDFRIVNAKHPQSFYPVGFVVSRNGKSVYFAGDTYDNYDMSSIDCDIAMIPIGGTYTMDILGAITALKRLKCSYAVPMHYNTWPKINANVGEFQKRVKQDCKCTAIPLQIGESFDF
jgi:L-ascorbate metabolism protein UlaG (beta-lactamase superfamily)